MEDEIIIILYDRDSHYISASNIEAVFFQQYKTLMFDVKQFLYSQFYLSTQADYIVFSCGGRWINYIIDVYHESNWAKPLYLTIFPGILVKNQLEAHISRARCDISLVSSNVDAFYNRKICHALGLSDNSFIWGPVWFNKSDNSSIASSAAVFYCQDEFLVDTNSFNKLYSCLISVAVNNPGWVIYIKPRNNKGDNFYTYLSSLPKLHERIVLYDRSIQHCLTYFPVHITISSSAVIPAISSGKSVFILKDFYSKKHYSHYFKKSKLIKYARNIDLSSSTPPCKNWYNNNISINPRRQEYLLKYLKGICHTNSRRPRFSNIILVKLSCRCFIPSVFRRVQRKKIFHSLRLIGLK
ncbi:DUF6716 putative glycosyltransferase [Cobetia amphilecti]|uniref:DUF6716 putative glycosyltransferase n=1 Tax=Cobetia amphilecti TaxID=1055104 RepID=UPI002549D1C7|nr:DUF6716 putative glycosyltransferase [Cobetia amphilecti]